MIDFDCPKCEMTSEHRLSSIYNELEIKCPICKETFTIFLLGEDRP